jgi:hypothetical protein
MAQEYLWPRVLKDIFVLQLLTLHHHILHSSTGDFVAPGVDSYRVLV